MIRLSDQMMHIPVDGRRGHFHMELSIAFKSFKSHQSHSSRTHNIIHRRQRAKGTTVSWAELSSVSGEEKYIL